MHKAIRAAVLSITPMLMLMATPWFGATAEGANSSLRTAIAAAGNPTPPASAVGYVYVVQPTDTLWDIAAVHGITVKALVAANKLADPHLLRPGQSLWVPAPRPSGATSNAQAPADAESAASALPSTKPLSAGDAPAPPPGKEGWPMEMLAFFNEGRAAAGLPQLSWSAELARAAQAHAEDCAGRERGGHTGSDGSMLAARIERQGITVRWASENWAYAQSVQGAFALWWNEASGLDPHRRNILDPRYTEVGIGVANSEWGTYFIADFGGR
jgi:uncharacterized protein YkwD